MSSRSRRSLVVVLLLSGCATRGPAPARQYERTADSATNGCLRNPACYTQIGNEAPLPWVSQSVNAARSTVAVLRLLEAAELARIEQVLTECAQAHAQVNDRELGEGRRPTREECNKVLRREQGQDVTLAMELGRQKHEMALDCARTKLGPLFPDNVRFNPHYKLDATGQWRLLAPELVAQWLREGLFNQLLGTLVPDVVVHASGNPLRGQRVYDFKFPCMPTSPPSWRQYPKGHPHHPQDQGGKYKEAVGLEAKPSFVSPQFGVSQ
jgi:hypothetical protein